MARKETRIQMDGMCRVPSSRPVKDGMASESLNVVSDMGECVPVLPPELAEGEDIPDSWGEGNGEMVFVHVQPTYTNHVYQVENTDGTTGVGTWAKEGDGWVFTPFMEMAEGETLNDIVGIGNTLVVSTSEATHYVLWKEGSYRDLGTELPKPAVVFYGNGNHQVMQWGGDIDGDVMDYVNNHICTAKGQRVSDDDDEDEIMRRIWDAYDDVVANVAALNDGMAGRVFYQPYFFRCALRLYDDTYAMQSVPTLVGGEAEWPQMLGTYRDGSTLYGWAEVHVYYAFAQLMEEVSQDWGDIVTAIDVFCSSPINLVDPWDGTITAHDTETVWVGDKGYAEATLYMTDPSRMEDRLLNYNVFYRIGSFLIDNSAFSLGDDQDYDAAVELTANQSDLRAGIRLKKPDADTLVTHTSTASADWDDYGADSTYHGNAQRVMNQRLAIWDIDETLGRGLPVLPSCTAMTTGTNPTYSPNSAVYAYRFMYVVATDEGDKYVWGAYAGGGTDFLPVARLLYNGAGSPSPSANTPVFLLPCLWLAYPDARCVRVLFQRRGVASFYGSTVSWAEDDWGDVMTLDMKEHPFLNCSYHWGGFGEGLEGERITEGDDFDRFTEHYEDRLVRDTNTVMLSGAANPFTFPMGTRYTFDYAVVSCATANMPLSTGQFGQFPLYVFTKGGIWAMSMNADGTFASSSPFSRDVALSHKVVCEIDQGIVFIAGKAVLAIQGGQITDISQLMTGRHDPLPDSAVSALENCGYGVEADDDAHTVLVPISALEGAWTDGSAFMAFMADATAGYDYLGDRMIFINGNFNWQWVWMRKTATWHRTMLWEGDYGLTDNGAIKIRSFVNSWPGLLANLVGADEDGDRACAVGEMTSQLDRTRDESLASTGLYVSRPLTLDSPDVFKSVMDLRIRGDLRRGNARHLLLSSNNGHDWVLRRSLRGPSFKFHRIAVVTKMTTNERLSYLEIEYDERFTNRLR